MRIYGGLYWRGGKMKKKKKLKTSFFNLIIHILSVRKEKKIRYVSSKGRHELFLLS